jgi:magnesium-transporting ATPase (P-type)
MEIKEETMELIAGILGMIICWRGRAYKEIRLFFASFAMLTFYFCYIMILSQFVMPRTSLWEHEIFMKFLFAFFTIIPLMMHAVIYGTLLTGIYKTIKRFQGKSKEEGTKEQ